MKEYMGHIIMAFSFAIIAAVIYEHYHNTLLLLSISFLAFVAIITYDLYRRRKENISALKKVYSFIGKSLSLKPKDVLGKRPFNPYYYRRQEDDLIDRSLNNQKNILIVGPPLSGKTRAIFQALTNLDKPQKVAVPICKDINAETFEIPKNTEIIFIDDLHRFVEQQNFDHLFRTAINDKVIAIATCRSGIEHKKVRNKMLDKNIILETTFENIIELSRIQKDVGKEIAEKLKISWNEVKFDGTPGSIFLRLEEMRKRFDNCNDIEKTILRAIMQLYVCRIYEENLFPLEWIKMVAKKQGVEGRDYEWTGWLENLKDKELITLEGNRVQVEEVYLEDIVVLPVAVQTLNVLEETIAIFSDVPEALFKLGTRAYDIGTIDLEKAAFMKTAIRAYDEALKVYTLERFPMDYAMTQNNLGVAYSSLAEVEAKADNCKKAIRAHDEALKVRTLDRFPMQYAMSQNNLGITYHTLAEIEAKADNCKKAIRAHEEALKVFTEKEFPEIYPLVAYNLESLLKFYSNE